MSEKQWPQEHVLPYESDGSSLYSEWVHSRVATYLTSLTILCTQNPLSEGQQSVCYTQRGILCRDQSCSRCGFRLPLLEKLRFRCQGGKHALWKASTFFFIVQPYFRQSCA